MPTAYRVEQAKSGRAVCRNKECKDNGVKIEKDDLRFGTLVEIKEVQSWHWKHWGCVTPLQLDKWWNELAEQNLDMIDGYDDLPADMQAKVKRSLEQGHVDDEDWKGDIERNRPGQKGMRTPKGKKSKAEANGAEIVEDPASPSKPPTKKRGRPSKKEADDDDDDDEDEKVPAKKAKKSSKAKTKSEETGPAPGNDSTPAKKRGRPKKAAAPDNNDTKPTEKKEKRGRPKKAQNADAAAVEEPAKKRGRPKKAPADKGEDAPSAPAKKRGRPKKAAATNVEAS